MGIIFFLSTSPCQHPSLVSKSPCLFIPHNSDLNSWWIVNKMHNKHKFDIYYWCHMPMTYFLMFYFNLEKLCAKLKMHIGVQYLWVSPFSQIFCISTHFSILSLGCLLFPCGPLYLFYVSPPFIFMLTKMVESWNLKKFPYKTTYYHTPHFQ